jgi:hypothetical protein
MIAKRIVIKGWGCRSGECVRKEIELTLGDLQCVLESGLRERERTDHIAEVSRGRSRRKPKVRTVPERA